MANSKKPAHGALSEEETLQLQEQTAGDEWSGSAPRRAKAFWPSAKRLVGLLSPFKTLLILVAAMNIICVFLAVYAPKVMGRAMDVIFSGVISAQLPSGASKDEVIAGLRAQGQDRFADMASAMDLMPGQGIDFGHLGRLITIVIGMYIVSSAFQLWQGRILNRLVMDSVYQLRADVEAKIHSVPLNYFDSNQRGDVLSRTTNDIDNVQQALQQALSQIFYNILLVAGITVMMFSVSWQLALIALLSLPLTGLVIGVIGSRSQKQFTTQWRSTGQLNGHVEESFSGHELALVFGRTDAMSEEFDSRNEELFRSAAMAQFLSGMMMPIMQFISYLSYVAIAVFGGLRVASGNMTLGDATAFIQYSREFNQPLGQLGGMMQQIQSGVASAERVFEFLDSPDETAEKDSQHLTGRARGLVEFCGVDFSYEKDSPLIQDLDLRVEPGETAAIVGPTGAGKTTLVNLIMRFYDIDGGHIYLDGIDTAQMPRHELRSQVGMVLQDAVVFDGTIMDNIRYGRLDASDEEVIAAAKATYVDRFVHSLPEGYNTVIDQDGGAVSAGERQLITIARAFLAQPALLILDEATSSVDTRTEMLVQQAMSALRADRTSFVIAHRLSTIRNADVILVMENGAIVEQGTHEELLAKRGAYWRLSQSQFSEED
ncbi:MAG: ABC transporter ATP-binding protein/permease [Corynebacterium flavescens]|uniref:ABC transporter ATP-binding protein n=1 Tax=Corynebacterium flavescens TaxID=28028 RepID=UPI0026489D20|nr:ABC transporter ATP-binding protein [Corynebacterium flavescens]MDN6098791.1 ABC transporter ATP-binding protein/permease [Corynebacterium flavescens]MDN6199835.1 ABC transporter ATP-binding protein/permease [Corynebacterium flavescens]MDN6225510.1 ABC transporter ATP-binding protein/permease [Corynebacterium flavescens]MDN6236166.1 ABC transporter ATP-binding protein/permease [Corynebacterium flavescens]MDN6531494.1 ABC transporter ATP-binding protein/permease [Corynebacterium flavescens]